MNQSKHKRVHGFTWPEFKAQRKDEDAGGHVAALAKEVEAMMEPKVVRKLEQEIEDAVAEVIVGMGLKKSPLLPSQQTMHLMAKAAVTVYETAVENRSHK